MALNRDYSGEKNPKWRGGLPQYNCAYCGATFGSYSKGAKFCSRRCIARYHAPAATTRLLKALAEGRTPDYKKRNQRPSKWKDRCCVECGATPVRSRKSQYCVQCGPKGAKRAGGPVVTCVICAKQYQSHSQKKTCSPACYSKLLSERQKGERSHLWKGGKTTEAMRVRNSMEYAAWRKAVFMRDDYTCQHCGERGGQLDADHIRPFSTHPSLRFDVENGRTLCRVCHRKTETWGHKAGRST